MTTLINPYYDELKRNVKRSRHYHTGTEEFVTYSRFGENFREFRRSYVIKYAWAIPTEEAIRAIAKFSNNKIVEIGAGTGYWAWLLQQVGVTVHAYDKYLENNPYKHEHTYTELKKGGHNTLRKYNHEWTLFLCWPPFDDPMASRCLRRFTGRKFIYIGESEYGCTGDNRFHEALDKWWNRIDEINIPQWNGIHDYVQMYERK